MSATFDTNSTPFNKWAAKAMSMQSRISGALQTIALPFLFEGDSSAQSIRFMSVGASEGQTWAPLNEKYAKRKLKRFANYPGGGTKMLVATGRLLGANTGRPELAGDYNKLIQGTTLYVSLGIPYARFVNKRRNIVKFSAGTYNQLKDLIKTYMKSQLSGAQ